MRSVIGLLVCAFIASTSCTESILEVQDNLTGKANDDEKILNSLYYIRKDDCSKKMQTGAFYLHKEASEYGFSMESQVWTLVTDVLNKQKPTNLKVVRASNAGFPVIKKNPNRGDVAVLVLYPVLIAENTLSYGRVLGKGTPAKLAGWRKNNEYIIMDVGITDISPENQILVIAPNVAKLIWKEHDENEGKYEIMPGDLLIQGSNIVGFLIEYDLAHAAFYFRHPDDIKDMICH